ncbi:resolvase [Desulfonema ishimotonii]|uniref:Resolvase n=1 Tax=Desulfonema ishimotonii TaxID=45657 RepID=A0A401G0V1_9BACT|nr:resolvase [Desulfonema ishimotonii]
MKLSHWAKKTGITYKTAWNLFKQGKIPGAYQLESGTIIVPDSFEEKKKGEYVVCYARVSSSQNKNNLVKQAERLTAYANAKGWQVRDVIKEVGSGLNDKRPKFIKMISSGRPTKIIVEHSDRLTRFGFSFLSVLLEKQGCAIEVINGTEDDTQDLMQDFISVITSFCARIYGIRRCKKKTEKIIRELENEDKKVM